MWMKAPEHYSLVPGVIHLWKLDLLAPPDPLEYYQEIISNEEKERAARFYFPKDAHQFMVGRAVLRILLGRYLDVSPASLSFTFSEFGKPSVANAIDLHFNISHSGGLAVMGFTRAASIGVDLEKVKPNLEIKPIASRFFAEREQEVLFSLPDHLQLSAFYQCWTSKEAFIKAHGQGLSLPLDEFEVEVHPAKEAALKSVHWEPELATHWHIRGFQPADGFRGAVVRAGGIDGVGFYRVDDTRPLC